MILGTGLGTGLLLLVFALGVMFGYIHIGIKSPSQKAFIYPKVCDEKVIERYNKTFTSNLSQEDFLKSKKQLADEVLGMKDYSSDATCNYIALSYYLTTDDVSKVTELYDSFRQSLSDSVLSVDLIDVQSPQRVKTSVDIHTYENRPGARDESLPNG